MKRLDLSPLAPAENLAADEVFLDAAENGGADEMLLFWEPRETFVVAGYANKIATEVNVENCAAKKIPIFRRCSGGGTILQTPGGLNYSLILRIDASLRNITAANQFIMERNRAAIESEARRRKPEARININGCTDLTLVTGHSSPATPQKFSGNSQRRRKNFLLFHGTILLDCDLNLISEFLRMPSAQPDYRARRPHENFLTNLNLPTEKIKAALAKVWGANEELKNPPLEKISELAFDKYSTREWNFKF